MRSTLLTFVVVLFANPLFAQVVNGDFERWSLGQPDAWSTVDSGIQLLPSSGERVDGNQAAKVVVTTTSQSNTDLRQSLNLIANQTYLFEVSVFHTEGGIRARLYVDGFQTYSDPALINQWQTISYQYTPFQNETIEVGLRFYDVSGFDGNEVVIVDAFRPNQSTSTTGVFRK